MKIAFETSFIAKIDKQFYEKLKYDLILFSPVGLFLGDISPWVYKRIIEIFKKLYVILIVNSNQVTDLHISPSEAVTWKILTW